MQNWHLYRFSFCFSSPPVAEALRPLVGEAWALVGCIAATDADMSSSLGIYGLNAGASDEGWISVCWLGEWWMIGWSWLRWTA